VFSGTGGNCGPCRVFDEDVAAPSGRCGSTVVVKMVLSAEGVATSWLVPVRGTGSVAINREIGATKPDSTGAAAVPFVDVSPTGAMPLRL
jgi:hypothetical protein